MDTFETLLRMQKSAVIFTGLQASGKSSFYNEYLAATHARVSLDELRTRNKEKAFLEDCIAKGSPFVADNTNPSAQDRARYIAPAKQAGYFVAAVFFENTLKECLERNKAREAKSKVPDIAIVATSKKMEAPMPCEGFDAIYRVRAADGRFIVK